MKRLAVLGHPVAPLALAGDARARRWPSWGWPESGATRRSTWRRTSSRPRVRAMPGEGFVGANVTVPHKGAALALADSLSETAREIGAANTLSFAAGEVRADNTDAQGLLDALPESPARQAGARAGRGRRRPGRRLGAGPRGGRGRRLESHGAARRAPLRRAGRRAGGDARPGCLRADRQHQRGGAAWRGSVRRLAARPGRLRRRADRRRPRLRRAAEPAAGGGRGGGRGRRSTESRSSSARVPSRCGSGPGASRRSTRCEPRRADSLARR